MIKSLHLLSTLIIILCTLISHNSYAQTEGFNVKTPIQKIADSTSEFLKNIIEESKDEPEKSIPQDLVCSSTCFIVIPEIEIVQSRGDFTGTGLMACRNPKSDQFTEPLFYKVNNLHSFQESGGGLVVLVTDEDGMKAVLGSYVHLNSDNTGPGKVGKASAKDKKSFIAYAKPKNEELEGYDMSGSVITYSSRDTFNAYQGTIIPIEILVAPEDVPPVLRDFDKLLAQWNKVCE